MPIPCVSSTHLHGTVLTLSLGKRKDGNTRGEFRCLPPSQTMNQLWTYMQEMEIFPQDGHLIGDNPPTCRRV